VAATAIITIVYSLFITEVNSKLKKIDIKTVFGSRILDTV